MTPEARVAAAIDVLDASLGGASAEKTLTNWARRNRYAGSGDRAGVRDLVFAALRCRRSFAWLGGSETGRGLMLGRLRAMGEDPASVFTGQGYAPSVLDAHDGLGRPIEDAPLPICYDCPDWLWADIQNSLGDDAIPVLERLQTRAPVFLRANTARTTRDEAIDALAQDGVTAVAHPLSPTAIEVTGNPRKVQASQAYTTGKVELQDAASQAVTDVLAKACQGGSILDYCAGGGGKSLALAARPGFRLTAHDIDPNRMKDIAARAERAGVDIAVTEAPEGVFDAVLCDAPCSGSGAWRRQPEAKWSLTRETLAQLNDTQDAILDRAVTFVAPEGILAYATCSLLECENDQRIDAFLQRHPGWTVSARKHLTPLDGGDGFFIAILKRQT